MGIANPSSTTSLRPLTSALTTSSLPTHSTAQNQDPASKPTTQVGTTSSPTLAPLSSRPIASSRASSSTGCDGMCKFHDRVASCSAHIQDTADTKYRGQAHACMQASGYVLPRCQCSDCSLLEAGCKDHAHRSKPKLPDSDFDCSGSLDRSKWSLKQKAWCCQHKHKG